MGTIRLISWYALRHDAAIVPRASRALPLAALAGMCWKLSWRVGALDALCQSASSLPPTYRVVLLVALARVIWRLRAEMQSPAFETLRLNQADLPPQHYAQLRRELKEVSGCCHGTSGERRWRRWGRTWPLCSSSPARRALSQ
jgi:hypothetical protein